MKMKKCKPNKLCFQYKVYINRIKLLKILNKLTTNLQISKKQNFANNVIINVEK